MPKGKAKAKAGTKKWAGAVAVGEAASSLDQAYEEIGVGSNGDANTTGNGDGE